MDGQMTATEYIHTFTKDEQDRLVRQGELLEPHLHKFIDLSGCSSILEIGCGVGAQLRLLFRRYPDLHMTGVDISETQIQRARLLLAKELSDGHLELHTSRGDELPFADGSFDAVYICFVLEHVPDPPFLMQTIHKALRDGGIALITESFESVGPEFPSHLPQNFQYAGKTHRLMESLGFANTYYNCDPINRPMEFTKIRPDLRGELMRLRYKLHRAIDTRRRRLNLARTLQPG